MTQQHTMADDAMMNAVHVWLSTTPGECFQELIDEYRFVRAAFLAFQAGYQHRQREEETQHHDT